MTDHTPAAQATKQEAVLTDDQIEALAKKHIAPHADRLDAIMQNPVPYQQTEQFRRVKALIVDVLSNARAPRPLGDSCHHCGWTDWVSQDGAAYCQACGRPHGSVPAEGLPNLPQLLRENADLDEAEGGNPQVCTLERDAADEIERLRREVAKLRAPVADERAAQRRAVGNQYHVLKTDPEVFQAVLDGAKTFEIRMNDRGYSVGDALGLRETKHTGAEMRAGAPLVYTGRECQRFVSHVLTGYGLADGWCCLSFDLPHAGGASAPVAGEAQQLKVEHDRGFSRGWDLGHQHGSDLGFSGGVCVALQVITGHDAATIWREVVQACDLKKMLDYAANVEPDEWELAGFKRYVRAELNERKPRKRSVPAAPQASEAVQIQGGADRLLKLAAALGNRDWKWWDSCSFRRLTFADGPDRRDGGALCGWVQPSDGHPDVSMAPGVREFIEAASPKAIAALAAAYMAALSAQPGAQKEEK